MRQQAQLFAGIGFGGFISLIVFMDPHTDISMVTVLVGSLTVPSALLGSYQLSLSSLTTKNKIQFKAWQEEKDSNDCTGKDSPFVQGFCCLLSLATTK
jgi:hypothetical protein